MTPGQTPSVYLDANIFIHPVEGYPQHDIALQCVASCYENGRVKFFSSELTLAEVLVVPLREGRSDVVERYEQLLSAQSEIGLVSVDVGILRSAAERRAASGGGLLDAIHVATAARCGCSMFLSEDARVKVSGGMERLTLTEFHGRFAL